MSLLDDLGLNFKKSTEENKDSEVKKLIRDSVEKRDALVNALKAEENELHDNSDEVFKKMGRYLYSRVEDLKASPLMNDQMEVFLKIIRENESKIKELEAKRQTIVDRYQEEMDILGRSVEKKEEKVCPNCGAVNSSASVFCSNCGTKLQ